MTHKSKTQITDVIKNKGQETITAEELATLKASASKLADLEKSLQSKDEESQKLAKELEDLRKAKEESENLKAQLAEIQKAKEEQRKTDMTDLVKGYSFVAEEKQEDLVKALLGSKDAEILVSTLEKAKVALEEAVTSESGHDEEAELSDVDNDVIKSVQNILKARKTQ